MEVYERWCRLRVGEIMHLRAATVSKNETVAVAAGRLLAEGTSALLVVDEAERCVGILGGVDLAHCVAQDATTHDAALTLHAPAQQGRPGLPAQVGPEVVSQRMSSALQTVSAGESLAHAARVMSLEGIHHLPVLDERGRAAGLLSSLDLLKALLALAGDEG